METEGTVTKYMAANCEGSQNPTRAVGLRKKSHHIRICWYKSYRLFPCVKDKVKTVRVLN
jgi:hypothetical protein